MTNLEIKDYLLQVGIRKINELDTALIETFGQKEGKKHIEKLTALFDQSEERLLYGAGNAKYLHRQEELVDYLNQSLQMSLLAASFYDRVFFRRVMEYLLENSSFLKGDILDIGCGNGILTCFIASHHPDCLVTGLEISGNAVLTAGELAEKLGVDNAYFLKAGEKPKKRYDTLFSCRTAHENAAWKPLCEEAKAASSIDEQEKRHRQYAGELAAFLKPNGYLVSVERYEDDGAYAGFLSALERLGLCRVKGTHVQFSCKNGDETAVFQAMVFQKI